MIAFWIFTLAIYTVIVFIIGRTYEIITAEDSRPDDDIDHGAI